jgi:N-acetylneuraminate synthase/sialic acid synthase
MIRQLVIDSCTINDESDCYVIAEIGHNHQGSLEKAKAMFHAAKECGVNAVKLQKRNNRVLYTRAMFDSPYDNENSFGETYGLHREALEFNRDQYIELQRYATELGLTMFSTAFDFPSADFLAELDMPAFKIASGDLVNIPLLKYIARFGKPMVISTGGSTMEDVQRAFDTVMPINPNFCLLQCTANYPADPEEMNLRVISTLRDCYKDTVIGLSDHQNGIAMAVVAYTLGARVIEKHFTMNRAWRGTDQAFSLEPAGMRRMVRDLQRSRVALGDGNKRPIPVEQRPMIKMRKKLVAARDLTAGTRLAEADVAFKSPGDGLPPYELVNMIGKVICRDLKEDENITFTDLMDS